MKIERIESRAIPDTRGRPTVETTLFTARRHATASVPSGKSTGSHEVKELRDQSGGVSSVISKITGEIARKITARDFSSPDELDEFLIELDGTPDKSHLGGNAILSISIAGQRLFADEERLPLWTAIAQRAQTTPAAPRLFVNVLNGGVHADFRLPFQEYMLVVGGRISSALSTVRSAFEVLGARLEGAPMGDEGGYSPTLASLDQPFEMLDDIVREHPDASIAIDAAASEFYRDGHYHLLGAEHSAADLASVYKDLISRFALHSIEDPFNEDAHADFAALTKALGSKTLIVGDDLTTTNPTRIASSIANHEINAVLIKPNQIGTIKETIEAVRVTREAGMQPICSHRSGETMDTFIADFAFGVGAYGIKAGGLGQKERLEKYERLLTIERNINTV